MFSETVSIRLQWDAMNRAQATKNYNQSCNICCKDPSRVCNSCDTCKVRVIHEVRMQQFADKIVDERF